MAEKGSDSGAISWWLFNDLYENQSDLLRKLRFFIKAGKMNNTEALALDMIEDYIGSREAELEKIRQEGLREWNGGAQRPALQSPENRMMLENRAEDAAGRALAPIGSPYSGKLSFWNRLKSRIKGTPASG